MRISRLINQVSIESEALDSIVIEDEVSKAEEVGVEINEIGSARDTLVKVVESLESTIAFMEANPNEPVSVAFLKQQTHQMFHHAQIAFENFSLESVDSQAELTLAMEGVIGDLGTGIDNLYQKFTKKVGDWWTHNNKALLASAGEAAALKRKIRNGRTEEEFISVSGLHDIGYHGKVDIQSVIRGYQEFIDVQQKLLETTHTHTLEFYKDYLRILKQTAQWLDRLSDEVIAMVYLSVTSAVLVLGGPVPYIASSAVLNLLATARNTILRTSEKGEIRVSELDKLVSEARENSRKYMTQLMRDYAYADKELVGGYIAVVDKKANSVTGALSFKREGTKTDSSQKIRTPTIKEVETLVDLVVQSTDYFRTKQRVWGDLEQLATSAQNTVLGEIREETNTDGERANKYGAIRNGVFRLKFGYSWFFETVINLGHIHHSATRSVLNILRATEKAYKV